MGEKAGVPHESLFWKINGDFKIENNDTTYIWSITEMMKPGLWDWGIAAHDIATDNNNTWILGEINLDNRSIEISKNGKKIPTNKNIAPIIRKSFCIN